MRGINVFCKLLIIIEYANYRTYMYFSIIHDLKISRNLKKTFFKTIRCNNLFLHHTTYDIKLLQHQTFVFKSITTASLMYIYIISYIFALFLHNEEMICDHSLDSAYLPTTFFSSALFSPIFYLFFDIPLISFSPRLIPCYSHSFLIIISIDWNFLGTDTHLYNFWNIENKKIALWIETILFFNHIILWILFKSNLP